MKKTDVFDEWTRDHLESNMQEIYDSGYRFSHMSKLLEKYDDCRYPEKKQWEIKIVFTKD